MKESERVCAHGEPASGTAREVGLGGPKTSRERCGIHKTAHSLNKFPQSGQRSAKRHLPQIWMAEGREGAEQSLDTRAAKCQAKCGETVRRLTNSQEALLDFPDLPTGRWKDVRITDGIQANATRTRPGA